MPNNPKPGSRRRRRARGPKGLSDEEILQDMRIAAQASPRGGLSEARYAHVGRYDSKTPAYRFGSWNEAMRRALPDVYERRHPSPALMIADLHRVADICRKQMAEQVQMAVPWRESKVRSLSLRFYNQHGQYTSSYLRHHLGQHLQVRGWPQILTALGIDVVMVRRKQQPSPQDMIADLHRVAEICRTQKNAEHQRQVPYKQTKVRGLSKTFYNQHGQYTWHVLLRRLGMTHLRVRTWREMKLAVGLDDV